MLHLIRTGSGNDIYWLERTLSHLTMRRSGTLSCELSEYDHFELKHILLITNPSCLCFLLLNIRSPMLQVFIRLEREGGNNQWKETRRKSPNARDKKEWENNRSSKEQMLDIKVANFTWDKKSNSSDLQNLKRRSFLFLPVGCSFFTSSAALLTF